MSTLADLISEGEHVNQDFKFRIDDQKKIARTLCAFANTFGGRLLIVIKDNKKIVGGHPEEEFHMIEVASKMFCQPEVPFTSKVWQEDFRLILEIQVPISNNTPHKAKDDDGRWKPYIRVKDHTVAVNKILEKVWIENKKPTSKPEKFNDDELMLLKLLQEHGEVTLSKLYRLSKLPLKKVDRLLVLLICWGLIEIAYETDGVYYKSKVDI